MKPGAVLFFIDNDAGGYSEIIELAAIHHNFVQIYGSRRHENYKNELLKKKRFGSVSCCNTTVSVHLLQKPMDYDNHLRYVPYLNNASPMPSPVRRTLLSSPINGVSYSPLTPYVHQAVPVEFPVVSDFAEDEKVIDSNSFHSPPQEILQSPRRPPLLSYIPTTIESNVINSPYLGVENIIPPPPLSFTPVRGRKKVPKHGCLPLPLKRWRYNLSQKINNFKFQARSLLARRAKHPVFRL